MLGRSSVGCQPLFSYARYNADLAPKALVASGFASLAAEKFGIDSLSAIAPCREIGKWVAETKVQSAHFDGFWS